MSIPARSLVALILLAAGSLVRADGLVQLSLFGQIHRQGGAQIEIRVARSAPMPDEDPIRVAIERDRPLELVLQLHLAEDTRAQDLSALLVTHLERTGFDVIAPPPSQNTSNATLFIEGVRSIQVRLGAGLRGRITVCDRAPTQVSVLPPVAKSDGAMITIGGTSFLEHTGAHLHSEIELDVGRDASAPWIAEQLANAGIANGWVCQRPTPTTWHAARMRDGSVLQGFSLDLFSESGWTLVVEL